MENYVIYWLISEDDRKTYTGFSNNINRRIEEHKNGKVKTTKGFGKFRCCIVEKTNDVVKARSRERYWKSGAGRKKIKKNFEKLKNNAAFV